MPQETHRTIGHHYIAEAFGASSSHITEITRGIDEGDRDYFHSFVTWEEEFKD
jgi:S-adenosylmethionine decarboxylase